MTETGTREVVNFLKERQKEGKMRVYKPLNILVTVILINFTFPLNALPSAFDEVTTLPNLKLVESLESKDQNANTTMISSTVKPTNGTNLASPTDLEAAGSAQSIVIPVDSIETQDNTATGSNVEQTFYGLIPPEAFQQYVNQFGPPYPYAPSPYPAPVFSGFVPPPTSPIYPSPYVVQTGYEGYIVPSSTSSATTTTISDKDSNANSTNMSIMSPLMALTNIITTLMMSTLFRIVATIVSALGMIFFSGAIMNAFCNYTALCEIRNKAVHYVRRGGKSEEFGGTIVEEITPERVRRAAEFVSRAISKYQKLQKLMADST